MKIILLRKGSFITGGKTKSFILLIFFFLSGILLYSSKTLSRTDSLFNRHEYYKGLSILKNSLKRENLSDTDKAEYFISIAGVYKDKVGDYKVAKKYHQSVLSLNLAEDNRYVQIAGQEIAEIEEFEEKYRSFDQKLKDISNQIPRLQDAQKIDEYIKFLLETRKQDPAYYRPADINYHLAQSYFVREKFGKAYKYFRKTEILKPAYYLFKPIKSYKNLAYKNWIRNLLLSISRIFLITFLFLTIFLFYLSRPWKWLKSAHLIYGIIVILAWSGLYFLIYYLLTKNFFSSEDLIYDLNLALPAFIESDVGSPGSEIVLILFKFSLIGIFWMFIFSFGLKNIKKQWKAVGISRLSGILLFSALTIVFYFHYCDVVTKTSTQEKNIFTKKLYFFQYDPEPYLLIEPKSYPGIDLNEIEDKNIREALQKFY